MCFIFTNFINQTIKELHQLLIFFSEARFGVAACVITAFSRVFAEVGVSMMLGGNIRNYTRTITTAIALETSKGEFGLSIALGLVLLAVAFAINFFFLKFTKLYRTADWWSYLTMLKYLSIVLIWTQAFSNLRKERFTALPVPTAQGNPLSSFSAPSIFK